MFKVLALCLVSYVLCAPQRNERFIESLGLDVGSLFDLDTLYCDVQILLDVLGSDPTEHACEAECHKLVQEGTVFNYGCPLVCHGLQNLAHYFHETPEPGKANSTCGGAVGNIIGDLFG